MEAMSASDLVEERCRTLPDCQVTRKGEWVSVTPTHVNSFEVGYQFFNNLHTVNFLGWHEDFSSRDEALNCFAFGLSAQCRLRVWLKGKFQYRWALEGRDEAGKWYEDSRTGLVFFPYWKRTSVVVLQNDLLKQPWPEFSVSRLET